MVLESVKIFSLLFTLMFVNYSFSYLFLLVQIKKIKYSILNDKLIFFFIFKYFNYSVMLIKEVYSIYIEFLPAFTGFKNIKKINLRIDFKIINK